MLAVGIVDEIAVEFFASSTSYMVNRAYKTVLKLISAYMNGGDRDFISIAS